MVMQIARNHIFYHGSVGELRLDLDLLLHSRYSFQQNAGSSLAYFRDSSKQWFLPNYNVWRIFFIIIITKFLQNTWWVILFPSLEELRGCVSASPPQLFLTLICNQDTSWFHLQHYPDSVRTRELLKKIRTRLWQMDRFGVNCNKTNQNTLSFFLRPYFTLMAFLNFKINVSL